MKIRTLLGVVVGLVVAGMATAGLSKAATVTYYYNGANFNFTSNTAVYDTDMRILGYLTYVDGTLDYFKFWVDGFSNPLDAQHEININNTTSSGINFTGDGSGPVGGWRIDLQKFNRDNNLLLYNIGIVAASGSEPDLANIGSGGNTFRDIGEATASQDGTWSTTPFAAIPLPAAAWLFLTGLGMVGVAAWRRRRVAQNAL